MFCARGLASLKIGEGETGRHREGERERGREQWSKTVVTSFASSAASL